MPRNPQIPIRDQPLRRILRTLETSRIERRTMPMDVLECGHLFKRYGSPANHRGVKRRRCYECALRTLKKEGK